MYTLVKDIVLVVLHGAFYRCCCGRNLCDCISFCIFVVEDRWRGHLSNYSGISNRHLLRLLCLCLLLLNLFRIEWFNLGEEPRLNILKLISTLHDVSRSYLGMRGEALICVHANLDGQGTAELPAHT